MLIQASFSLCLIFCPVFFSVFASPFDKDDQTSSTSTVSKRLLSNQSPPDTPSMREQVFYVSHVNLEILSAFSTNSISITPALLHHQFLISS